MSELTPERWREVSALLDRLLTVAPAERQTWLEREIADPELRAEVAGLAARAERPDGVLDGAAAVHLGTLLREEGFERRMSLDSIDLLLPRCRLQPRPEHTRRGSAVVLVLGWHLLGWPWGAGVLGRVGRAGE